MKTFRKVVFGCLFLAGVGVVPAGAGEPEASVPAALQPGDALLIRIEGLGGGLPEYREIVDSDGRIELPYLGFLDVEGRTLPAVEAAMAAAYAESKLATNAAVRLTYVTHFDPPPQRANLIRAEDPRVPVPAGSPSE